METKEPSTIYYSNNVVSALKRHISRKVDEETDPLVLSEISRMLDKEPDEEPFEQRFCKAKEFAYSHFDKEYARELETHNFYIEEPFPATICNSEEDFEKMIKESEESGLASIEELQKAFSIWNN